MIFLIYDINFLTPERGLIKKSITDTISKKMVTNPHHLAKWNCELCWRFTVRYLSPGRGAFAVERDLSNRYCAYHTLRKPKGKNSTQNQARYVHDRKLKKQFETELKSLNGRCKSNFIPPLKKFTDSLNSLTPQETRKVAYDLVHSRINKGNRLKVIKLYGLGKSVSEIADELGVSTQSVTKHLRTIVKIINSIRRGAYLDAETGEPINTDRN